MNFVGIDPSTTTGMVILSDDGTLLMSGEIFSKTNKDPQRFMDIAQEVVNRCNKGDVIVIEGFSYGSKGAGVSVQYGVGWLIRVALINAKLPYYEAPPKTVKKFATGKGQIKKENMILPIYKRWGFENDSDNIRDAYVMAQIARGLEGYGELTKEQQKTLEGVVKG